VFEKTRATRRPALAEEAGTGWALGMAKRKYTAGVCDWHTIPRVSATRVETGGADPDLAFKAVTIDQRHMNRLKVLRIADAGGCAKRVQSRVSKKTDCAEPGSEASEAHTSTRPTCI
jgi:hypothetical protein